MPSVREPPRTSSVATRIAIATTLLLAVVGAVVALHLTRLERERLIQAKVGAAQMMVGLFATSVSPAVDFDDASSVEDALKALGANGEVVYAAVLLGSKTLGELGKNTVQSARFDEKLTMRVADFDLVEPVSRPDGTRIGTVRVRLSLARENAAFAGARQKILATTLVVCAVVALLLVGMVRRLVTTPLSHLSRAARTIARGESGSVAVTSNDEVGQLGTLFNAMSSAITEREAQLAAASRRLQGVLDHTGQGILVFGPGGKVRGVRSRLASLLLRRPIADGDDLVDLLYPKASSTPLERQALSEWLEVAFGHSSEEWPQIAELAPQKVVLDPAGDARALELEFRQAPPDGGVPGIMLIATDVTAQRQLEKMVEAKDREHARQMAAMRRLAAGGAQAFVRFLEVGRARLDVAERLLDGQPLDPGAVEQVFQAVHTLRGEARGFELSDLDAVLGQAERCLSSMREDRAPAGIRWELAERMAAAREELRHAESRFVAASPIGAAVLDQMTVSRSLVNRITELAKSSSDDVRKLTERLAARPFGECIMAMVDSFPRWAKLARKSARLELEGRDVLVPASLARVLGGAVTHLVRNALAHGVELPEERERKGKSSDGVVRVTCAAEGDGVVVAVEDDGAGFRMEALEQRAAAAGGSGGRAAAHPAFGAGISTFGGDVDVAGYGVGLGAVRAEVEEVGYRVDVMSEVGKGARVRILPGGAAA